MENTVKKIIGLKCFVSNHIYGTMLRFELGYPEVYISNDEKDIVVEGEYGITVGAAKWTITNKEGIKVTSDDQLIERKAAISDLISHTVHKTSFNPDSSELKVTFSNNVELHIHPTSQELHTDEDAELWSLKTPDSIVSFYRNGKFDSETGSLKKLVIVR